MIQSCRVPPLSSWRSAGKWGDGGSCVAITDYDYWMMGGLRYCMAEVQAKHVQSDSFSRTAMMPDGQVNPEPPKHQNCL